MNIVGFSNWLLYNGYSKKVTSDIVSRLKRINKELLYSPEQTTIDEQYQLDSCDKLLKSLNRGNQNPQNLLINSELPINKTEISNYKSALNKYIKYLES